MDRVVVLLMMPLILLMQFGIIGYLVIVGAIVIVAYLSLPLGTFAFGALVGHLIMRMLHWRCECEVCRRNYRTDVDYNPYSPYPTRPAPKPPWESS